MTAWKKMVLLHGDAGEIVGYDRIPFPERVIRNLLLKTSLILKMLFVLHTHQPLVLVFVLIIRFFIKYMNHVQT